MSKNDDNTTKAKKSKNPLQHLLAGGCAGLVEASVCHPLDTIKTRMQLRRQAPVSVAEKVRHSLVEPALRFKHSLQEPALRLKHSLHEPATTTILNNSSTTLHEPGMGQPPATTTRIKAPTNVVQAPLGPFGTARRIVQREGFLALYKGLTAVYTGIVPKMAIRFVSFEQYKEILRQAVNKNSNTLNNAASNYNTQITFTAGLASGLTEAILVVTPAEVCKIRMQSQYHSLMDPAQMLHRKYTNVLQTAAVITREEGIGALYKGVVPTMLRQGCNQAVNFTAYNLIKQAVNDHQGTTELQHWQSLLIGGLSGGMGPLANNPLDVVKTRLQKQVVQSGKTPKYTGLSQACVVIAREEGVLALWKGITPRLMRIMPGQAITFMTYEAVTQKMAQYNIFQ